jgi:hypothetical protein
MATPEKVFGYFSLKYRFDNNTIFYISGFPKAVSLANDIRHTRATFNQMGVFTLFFAPGHMAVF